MTTLRKTLFFTLLACMLFTSFAQAAPTITIHLTESRLSSAMVKPNQFFSGWVVVSGLEGNINAVEYTLDLPPWLVITNPGYIDHALKLTSGLYGVAIGFGECHTVFDGIVGSEELVVQHFTGFASSLFDPYNLSISEFQGSPNDPGTAPRYSDCDGNITNLTVIGATLESVVVPNDMTSFSAVKALY